MEIIREIFGEHYKWIFSGIGVAVLSAVFTIIAFWLRPKNDININTKGNNSPGIVGRDYKIEKKDD